MNPYPPPPDQFLTMRQVFETSRDIIYLHLGANWRLCHIEIAAQGRVIHAHVACLDGTAQDINAYLAAEICHPAAIASAVLMTHRATFDPIVHDYMADDEEEDDEEEDDATDEEPITASDLRRYDA